MESITQLWFIQLLNDYPGPSWEDFKQQCHLRFELPIHSNKLGELAKLKQSSSVSEYQTHLEALTSQAGSLTQTQEVQLYLSG